MCRLSVYCSHIDLWENFHQSENSIIATQSNWNRKTDSNFHFFFTFLPIVNYLLNLGKKKIDKIAKLDKCQSYHLAPNLAHSGE